MTDHRTIVVYGARTCEDTDKTRKFLGSHGVPYRYIELEGDREAEAKVKAWNKGNRVTPTVLIGDQVVAEPSDEELAGLLGLQGV